MPGHVFVSYSRTDRAYVQKLADHLMAASISVWFDYRLVAGEQFDEIIQRNIDDAVAFIVVVTPRAYESRWVAREIAYAQTKGKQIIPLLLEESPTFLRLVDLHQEDVTGGAMPSAELMLRLRGLSEVDGASPDDATPEAGRLPNPWLTPDIRARIRSGEDAFRTRVVGQEQAIRKILDVLKRAVVGLSIAQPASDSQQRPRAVLLLAGPRGTGKLEAAAGIADLVFDEPSAYVRFSMGEFSREDDLYRLVGAPPGFVGHELGGELTNAVRERPYRVVVFDELEKAHPRFLDWFFQIIEDGRLTDSAGVTVDFSQSIIVGVSDLGITQYDREQDAHMQMVMPGDPYQEIEAVVLRSLRQHFLEVGRPEVLNRIGSNIAVFDFLALGTLRGIFDAQLANVKRRLAASQKIDLIIAARVVEALWRMCTDTPGVALGGREIGNHIESCFVNPLARYIFDFEVPPGCRLAVDDIRPISGHDAELVVVVERPA